ncbi:C2H2 type zinc-finger-domain-containing protein [Phellopilus nigrolimitatus]|nr:C2H2 type zinc-finger-domain-containing protein [Phellopilus nigrolimitatus]
MADTMMPDETGEDILFTCLSCCIAFPSAEEQRIHYRSDHHRYNMKRRVAALPPVSAIVFNQKVLDRRQETSIMASTRGSVCEVCNKIYTTENAYRSHVNSKKHKENEVRANQKAREPPAPEPSSADSGEVPPANDNLQHSSEIVAGPSFQPILTVDADATEEDITKTIDEKIAAARSRLSVQHCLFCAAISPSLEDNLKHMSTAHSFFVPDADYLVDIAGLITYLGEKIAVGNVCIYCNAKSREFRTLDAARKHMLDKSHCKIAYDSEQDSYPDHGTRKRNKGKKTKANVAGEEVAKEEWEDVEDDSVEADEIIEEVASSSEDEGASSSDDDDEDSVPEDNELTYGDSNYELVLPSGARIGHRSLRRYYAQSFPRTSLAVRNGKDEDPNSGAALVRRLIADKNSALVPRKGGFGAYGSGTDVVKARNRGEAREAGRHVREFRDQRRREEFKTRVGYRNNHQKHFRDPLLQVSFLPTNVPVN